MSTVSLITMLVEKGPGVTQGGTTICQGCLNSRLQYMSWRSMSVLYGAGNWIYRASRILEAIFCLSEAFCGLGTTF